MAAGQDERQYALETFEQGAYNFFRRPVQFDELKVLISRALHYYYLEQERRALHQSGPQEVFEGMFGVSPPMQEVLAAIRRVVATDVSVVIRGVQQPSSAGKEAAVLILGINWYRTGIRAPGPGS